MKYIVVKTHTINHLAIVEADSPEDAERISMFVDIDDFCREEAVEDFLCRKLDEDEVCALPTIYETARGYEVVP
jgi:hypothetical protein